MKKLKNVLTLILTNLSVLIVLLLIVNIISIFAYNSYIDYQKNKEYNSLEAQFPNYEGVEWANQHFKELNEIRKDYKSYIGWRTIEYSGKTVNINHHGIRQTPQHIDVNNHSSTIVFLGGSTMWGEGANDNSTIPSFFSQYGKGKYKTINFGEIAYRAFQSYIFLKLNVDQGFKPDVVVSYDGVNEIFGFRNYNSVVSHYQEQHMADKLRKKGLQKQSYSEFLFGPIKKTLSVIHKEKVKKTGFEKRYDLTEERTKKVAKTLLDAWAETKSLAEKNGALFFCILQPNTGFGSPNLSHLKLNQEQLEVYRQLYPEVLKLLSTPNYYDLSDNFIDLTHVLNGEEKFYIDYCHLSPNGNQVVAKNIYLEIEKRIKQLNKRY